MIIAASYQAKAKDIKLGVNVAQARSMCPGIVIMTPDPAKYREAHRLFKELLIEFTPDVVPKSIDEFVLDMRASPALRQRMEGKMTHNEAMLDIGKAMKQKIRDRLGEYVTVNVGISTNRFLAKYAAGFGKPDGMTLIDHSNLSDMYSSSKLMDFPGINTRYRARLRINGIYTPLDFLNADMTKLKKQVFKSINGYHWYMRLRGYETDTVEFSRKSIGHQHALSDKTMDMDELERLLIKLCEKTGRRLRKNNLYALGIHLYLGFAQDSGQFAVDSEQFGYRKQDSFERSGYGTTPSALAPNPYASSWHHGEKTIHRLYSTSDIYEAAKKLLHSAEIPNNVKIMSVHVFNLNDWDPEQLTIFDIEQSKVEGQKSKVATIAADMRSQGARKRTSDAVDAINDRYGEFVVTPAAMLDMQGTILDRIAFGQVRDM
jgi:DNA polymerase-4